jgi:superfamily II helicase
MSNKYNDIIREYRHENDLCQICGKELDWPAQMANMAVRYGRNDICKECRRKEPLPEIKKEKNPFL